MLSLGDLMAESDRKHTVQLGWSLLECLENFNNTLALLGFWCTVPHRMCPHAVGFDTLVFGSITSDRLVITNSDSLNMGVKSHKSIPIC